MIREFAEHLGMGALVNVTKQDLMRDGWKDGSTFYCFIAEYSGRIVGYIFVTDGYTSWQGGQALHIEDVFVRPAYRGKGIGALLLKEVAMFARERLVKRISLLVRHKNESTRLYRKLGFCSGDELGYFYIDGGGIKQLAGACDINTIWE